ncbi:unnamed protein product [Rhizophagus irregularis]|nr:unnamed protein product [Rhizophagus irregularis]
MRLEQDYYDSDKDNDELLPRLLALHSDHFHVKKYLQSNCQRVKKLLRTPSWTSLSSHFQKIISDIFPEKKDIQLIPSKGSTLPDISVDLTISLHSPPVDLLISSPSTSADLPIFSHSPLADLSVSKLNPLAATFTPANFTLPANFPSNNYLLDRYSKDEFTG